MLATVQGRGAWQQLILPICDSPTGPLPTSGLAAPRSQLGQSNRNSNKRGVEHGAQGRRGTHRYDRSARGTETLLAQHIPKAGQRFLLHAHTCKVRERFAGPGRREGPLPRTRAETMGPIVGPELPGPPR